ncbi:MAG: helix-turn-helix domain-containing protein [Haloferacaceae archaeon]
MSVPAREFTLGSALSSLGGLRVRLERVVPVGGEVIPYVWVYDEHIGDVEAALRDETDVGSFAVVDSVHGESLIRVEWMDSFDGILSTIVETQAAILDGVGEADGWRFQLRFPDNDALAAFYRRCVDDEVPVDVESVHGWETSGGPDTTSDLTDLQHETLRVALERGYFDVPRKVTLTELAAEMDVSDTAVSQRLRRGIDTVLEEVLQENTADGMDG